VRFSPHPHWHCIGDTLPLKVIGSLKKFPKVLEEVALFHPKELEESPLAHFVGFNAPIAKNVSDGHLRSFEVSADEDGPMTSKRVLLCTHERNPVTLDAFLHTFNPLTKSVCGGEPMVLYRSRVIAGGIGRPRPQFLPEENIGDMVSRQFFLKGLTVKLRMVAAVGCGADIADCRNAVLHEEIEKLRE
jgi:hypothetical protein